MKDMAKQSQPSSVYYLDLLFLQNTVNWNSKLLQDPAYGYHHPGVDYLSQSEYNNYLP